MGSFPRLTPDQLDLSEDTFDFTQSITDTLGPLGTSADGFDAELLDLGTVLNAAGDPGAALDDDLGQAGAIASSINPNSLADDAASLPASLAEGDSILSDAGTLLGSVQSVPPPPSGGAGGGQGTAAPSTNCTQRTNQYGLSQKGTFPGVKCDWPLTFQVFRVQDGPCTYSADVAAVAGHSTPPQIVSFTLVSGDPTVWKLNHHRSNVGEGQTADFIDVTVTPKVSGAKSHFDGVAVLVTTNPSQTLHVCMSVDCIP